MSHESKEPHEYTTNFHRNAVKMHNKATAAGFKTVNEYKRSKTKALDKAKEAPVQKLKRLVGESQKGRSDWKSMLGK